MKKLLFIIVYCLLFSFIKIIIIHIFNTNYIVLEEIGTYSFAKVKDYFANLYISETNDYIEDRPTFFLNIIFQLCKYIFTKLWIVLLKLFFKCHRSLIFLIIL